MVSGRSLTHPSFVHVLVTCKNEEDSIRNEGASMVTTCFQLYVYWDISRRSRAGYSAVLGLIWPISNSFEMLWKSSLPARIKKIRSKMKALEWSQYFPHYNPIGAICCHGNQSSVLIWPKTSCSLSPPQ